MAFAQLADRESLREAVRFSPTNSLAYARLAKAVLAEPLAQNPRRAGEAEFFSRYALKLSPDDPEVMKIRAEFIKAAAEQKP